MEENMKTIDTFQKRLEKALIIRNMKPVELHEKTGISESLLSKYLSNNAVARQKKLTLIADALDVNEVWLMGYDVPMEKETSTNNDFRYANHNGINTEGLNKDEIEEINRFVEFIRNKKKTKED
jgi:transcriptional regulator with XRE-family HTH domain